MKVFISYGAMPDQVTGLRIQALGAVYGMTVFVPPAYTRNGLVDGDTEIKLRNSDVIIGVVSFGLTDACWRELQMATNLNKQIIVMVWPQFADTLRHFYSGPVVLMDPMNPLQAEHDLVRYLTEIGGKAEPQDQKAAKALIGLGIVALGLVLLASASRDA